ncbi:hypothetical protein PUN28_007366 [Cardiocondyla obscurior]|uniref:Uncharacterized protein n=1 Tax=Cardiocondyla obscurior TaxID=286306 RepID=A0AAW2G6L0_9HYME
MTVRYNMVCSARLAYSTAENAKGKMCANKIAGTETSYERNDEEELGENKRKVPERREVIERSPREIRRFRHFNKIDETMCTVFQKHFTLLDIVLRSAFFLQSLSLITNAITRNTNVRKNDGGLSRTRGAIHVGRSVRSTGDITLSSRNTFSRRETKHKTTNSNRSARQPNVVLLARSLSAHAIVLMHSTSSRPFLRDSKIVAKKQRQLTINSRVTKIFFSDGIIFATRQRLYMQNRRDAV